jgi:hypothetical protein
MEPVLPSWSVRTPSFRVRVRGLAPSDCLFYGGCQRRTDGKDQWMERLTLMGGEKMVIVNSPS